MRNSMGLIFVIVGLFLPTGRCQMEALNAMLPAGMNMGDVMRMQMLSSMLGSGGSSGGGAGSGGGGGSGMGLSDLMLYANAEGAGLNMNEVMPLMALSGANRASPGPSTRQTSPAMTFGAASGMTPSAMAGAAAMQSMMSGASGMPSMMSGAAGMPGMMSGATGMPGMMSGATGMPGMTSGAAGTAGAAQGGGLSSLFGTDPPLNDVQRERVLQGIFLTNNANKLSRIWTTDATERRTLEREGLGFDMMATMRYCPRPRCNSNTMMLSMCEAEMPYTQSSYYACRGCPRCRMEGRLPNMMNMMRMFGMQGMPGMGAQQGQGQGMTGTQVGMTGQRPPFTPGAGPQGVMFPAPAGAVAQAPSGSPGFQTYPPEPAMGAAPSGTAAMSFPPGFAPPAAPPSGAQTAAVAPPSGAQTAPVAYPDVASMAAEGPPPSAGPQKAAETQTAAVSPAMSSAPTAASLPQRPQGPPPPGFMKGFKKFLMAQQAAGKLPFRPPGASPAAPTSGKIPPPPGQA